jgi:ElaA protein
MNFEFQESFQKKQTMLSLTKTCKSFSSLTPEELYSILQLRSEVFVVEQNCVFQDMDDRDKHCYHLMLHQTHLVAYSRLVPPLIYYPEMSIGRVITKLAVRGSGVGKLLMEESIERCYEVFGKGDIRIGAQCYAQEFYNRLGFIADGEVYDEDGIPHIQMVRHYKS